MIRHTTEADFDQVLQLARSMHAEAPNYAHLGLDDEKVRAALARSIADGPAFVHVGDEGRIDGCFHAIVGERWFSRDRIVTDLALFVRPDRRGGMIAYRLVAAFVEWCEREGFRPEEVMVGVTTGVHPEATGKFYERLGFERCGETYRLRSY